MRSNSLAMQNEHIREAKSPLSFCAAQNYFKFNKAERNDPSEVLRNMEIESDTEMSIKSITNWFESWKRYRAAVRELSHLTDRELADLGLQRSEIDLVARQSVGV
jgi:uncharacterized protein YjiS (DUF1127 family)